MHHSSFWNGFGNTKACNKFGSHVIVTNRLVYAPAGVTMSAPLEGMLGVVRNLNKCELYECTKYNSLTSAPEGFICPSHWKGCSERYEYRCVM